MADSVKRTCELPATPEAVWRALTEPSGLRAWLADEVELELWPGGDARFVVDGEERTGWVEEVVAPDTGGHARLAFWWQVPPAPASRVTFELEPAPRGTRLRIAEARPLDVLELVGIPLRGADGAAGASYGPALVAA